VEARRCAAVTADDIGPSYLDSRVSFGNSALIERNQPLRRDPADGLVKGLSPLLVRFRVAFAGVE